MHGSAERRTGKFSVWVALHNQTIVVTYGDPEARGTHRSVYVLRIFACRIIHWSRHLAGSAMSECFILINTIFLLFLISFNFKSKFERLGYHVFQCLVWAAISETGIYFVILYYYIYPAYLGSWYCPKGFLLWPLVGTEKVEMRSAGLSGYSVGSHLLIFHFDIFTGCDPLALGWYSVGSHLNSIC
jgi:hypothetical protein